MIINQYSFVLFYHPHLSTWLTVYQAWLYTSIAVRSSFPCHQKVCHWISSWQREKNQQRTMQFRSIRFDLLTMQLCWNLIIRTLVDRKTLIFYEFLSITLETFAMIRNDGHHYVRDQTSQLNIIARRVYIFSQSIDWRVLIFLPSLRLSSFLFFSSASPFSFFLVSSAASSSVFNSFDYSSPFPPSSSSSSSSSSSAAFAVLY